MDKQQNSKYTLSRSVLCTNESHLEHTFIHMKEIYGSVGIKKNMPYKSNLRVMSLASFGIFKNIESAVSIFWFWTIFSLVKQTSMRSFNFLTGALKSTSEMFLMETLDNKISQILALHAISKYWQLNCHDDNKIPEFKDATMKRNLSAALFCIGKWWP